MQNYAKSRGGRPVTPQNGQPKSNRQVDAANARVKMTSGVPTHQAQAPSGIPARGLNAQNSSAPMQQGAQRRVSGQAPGYGLKRDPYDTDAESIDTTVNQSVVQVEDSQQRDHQHQQNGQTTDLGEEEDEEDEANEEGSDEGEPGYEYAEDGYVFTLEDEEFLREHGLLRAPRENQLYLLQQAARGASFPVVEGDSYPTTTNGDPSEWGGGQEAPSDFHNGGGPVSPSPHRPNINSQSARLFAPQPQQSLQPLQPPRQQSNMPLPNHGTQKSLHIFQQGANLRDQDRSNAPFTQYGGQAFQHNGTAMPSSQPPTYSQANPAVAPALPLHTTTHPNTHVQTNKHPQQDPRQPSGPSRGVKFQLINPKPAEPSASLKRTSSARANPELVVQQQPIEQAPVEEFQDGPDGDYDHDTLFKMEYEDLKNEEFDTDPRAKRPALHEEDLKKTLDERLELAQRNLDAGQQSIFFLVTGSSISSRRSSRARSRQGRASASSRRSLRPRWRSVISMSPRSSIRLSRRWIR
jgi:hypothetical protein